MFKMVRISRSCLQAIRGVAPTTTRGAHGASGFAAPRRADREGTTANDGGGPRRGGRVGGGGVARARGGEISEFATPAPVPDATPPARVEAALGTLLRERKLE